MASIGTNLAILGGSGLALVVADNTPDKTARQTLRIAAGIAGFIAALDIGLTAKKLIESGNKEFWDAVKEAASLPYGSGSLFEIGLGDFGRLLGKGPGPGVSTSPDRGAEAGPYLGTPKNVYRVAGIIRTIENQEVDRSATLPFITVPTFADTVLVDGAVENQSNAVQTGSLTFRTLVNGSPIDVAGPSVTLAPGELRQVSARIPRSHSSYGRFDIAMQYRGHSLDRVAFNVR